MSKKKKRVGRKKPVSDQRSEENLPAPDGLLVESPVEPATDIAQEKKPPKKPDSDHDLGASKVRSSDRQQKAVSDFIRG